MTTMAQAIRAYAESGGKVTADQIKRHINSQFPGQWKPSTLQAHLYACVANNPKAYIHHPSAEKFLYRNADGTFELYSESLHGPNEWAPAAADDEVTAVEELAETSISLERDIEDHLVHHLDAVEKGLKLMGRQVTTDVGRIDILAEDANGTRVVIEVKVGDAKDSAVGQIARYLGWYAKTEGKAPRGILIAGNFAEGVQYTAAAIRNLTLISYRVHFSFEHVATWSCEG
jgi:RecB family endonuclease NucS